MNYEEIIKAWEKVLAIGDAPIGEYWGISLTTKLAKETFDFINSQQAEIEELTEQLNFIGQEYKKLYEKNKKLLLKLCEKTSKASKTVEKIISSEARKEFADEFLEKLNQENDLYVRCAKNLLSEDFQRGYEEKNEDVVKIVRHLLKEVETDEE